MRSLSAVREAKGTKLMCEMSTSEQVTKHLYLSALISKWRNKQIKFQVEFPTLNTFEIVAMMLEKQRYVSVRCFDLESGCRVIDEALTKRMENV